MATHGGNSLLERRHLRRHCVRCGLAADAMLTGQQTECPRCGCDFATRPPRSYAEMEGLLHLETSTVSSDAARQVRADAAAARWLLLLLGVAAGAIAAVLGALLMAGR